MIETNLILIEGVPCSGKSCTAERLARDISAQGIRCNCYLEWSEDNPISIGQMEDLAEIIASTKSRQTGVFRQWQSFVERAAEHEEINIIESRLWQAQGMYLYLSGHSEKDVLESTRRLNSVIAVLKPILIYLTPTDVAKLHAQVAEEKNKTWRQSGREGSWEDWGNAIYEGQQWFTRRSLTSEAMAKFFEAWMSIAERLFERYPFRKIKIRDPQMDWVKTIGTLRDFLQLDRRQNEEN